MHTPGPWVVDDTEYIDIVAPAGRVAMLDSDALDHRAITANARLIAAAPDLLIIVRALIDIAGTPDELDGTGHHDMADLARMAQAAIARATRGDA